MTRFLLSFVVAVATCGPCCSLAAAQSSPYHPEALPPSSRSPRVRLISGPTIELARPTWAIITWTSSNPSGADEHFGVAHYGTDPRQLNLVAKSHIRLNRGHRTTVFRVRIDGLKSNTTYYYSIASMGGDGTVDNMKSPESHFRTP